MKLTAPKRLAVHALLLAGSLVFLFPFLWLVISSLKPIEQTMKMPPDWLPRAYYAPVQGERLKVKRERQISEPSVIVRATMPARRPDAQPTTERKLLPAANLHDGTAEVRVGTAKEAATVRVPATVERHVPTGHWLVREKVERLAHETGPPLRWDCVPPDAIEERIEAAWSNYSLAIRYTRYHPVTLFGRTVDVPYFVLYVYNTVVVAVLGMVGTVLASSLAAYGFSRIRWRGRDTCFFISLCTMMVPFAVTMIPLYGVFKALDWIGSLKPLWVPACFGGAFNIFLLRQFFRTIPQDLTDAARIDGCSEFGIYWRIILPLSKPALAVVALFHFMWAWRDFMGPLIYLNRQETYTLSLGLQFYQSQHGGSEWHYLMAASTMMILPVILLFFFTQRTFIQGISTTGIKG